jgi:DNA-binding GntR family transcriptional regulator
MAQAPAIVVKSLREQVYDHLRAELRQGGLDTGSFLDLNRLAADLGVSRTPLRDALLQLEVEGFVTISARRGVAVRSLEEADIRELYQLIGALEAAAVAAVGPSLSTPDLARLRELDQLASEAIERGDQATFYEHNAAFHDLFLDRLGNGRIRELVHAKKQQLYEWNRRFERLHAAWERSGLQEHESFLRLLEQGAVPEAAAYLRDVHWGFEVQEAFIREAYFPEQP